MYHVTYVPSYTSDLICFHGFPAVLFSGTNDVGSQKTMSHSWLNKRMNVFLALLVFQLPNAVIFMPKNKTLIFNIKHITGQVSKQ